MRIHDMLAPCLVAIAIALGGTPATNAEPIRFVHEGRGTGSIDGNPFPAADFVITAHANTDDRINSPPHVFFIHHDTAEISINGVGDFEFVTPTWTFVNQSISLVGVSRNVGGDLFNGPTNPAFASWDMLTSIGPFTGNGQLLQWSLSDVETAGGVLLFDNINTVVTKFTATVVPEPSSLILMLSASLGLRKRRLVKRLPKSLRSCGPDQVARGGVVSEVVVFCCEDVSRQSSDRVGQGSVEMSARVTKFVSTIPYFLRS